MKKNCVVIMTAMLVLGAASVVSAQQTSWKTAFKTAAQAAVQQLSPQAQVAVDQAKKLSPGAPQENFLVAKAKEFMAAGNYQPALDLANYVLTTLNSKSVDAKKIMADAKAALAKMAQDKLNQAQQAAQSTTQQGQAQATAVQQAQTDATQTGKSLKNMFGGGTGK